MRNFLIIFFVATSSVLANASEEEFLSCLDIPYVTKNWDSQTTTKGGWREAWSIEYHKSYIYGDSIKPVASPGFPYDPSKHQKIISSEDLENVLLGVSQSVPDLLDSGSYVELSVDSTPFLSRIDYYDFLYINEKLLTGESNQGIVIAASRHDFRGFGIRFAALCSRLSKN